MIPAISIPNLALQFLGLAQTAATLPLAVSSSATGTVADAEGVANLTETAITGAANEAQTTSMSIWNHLQKVAMFTKEQSSKIAVGAFQAARTAETQAVNRAGQIALDTKNSAKSLYQDSVNIVKQSRTMRFILKVAKTLWPIFKWVWILTKLMNNLGVWMVRVIEVIIYRIFHLKSCFLWYFLEIIGFILYVPIEFIVWLFCLQEVENSIWKLIEDIDCFLYDFTGFHVFHYSDTILQKCYSKKFPPFPYEAIAYEGDGNFSEKDSAKFVVKWFLPPSPEEVAEAGKTAVQLIRESGPFIKEMGGVFRDEISDMFPHAPSDPNALKNAIGDIFSF